MSGSFGGNVLAQFQRHREGAYHRDEARSQLLRRLEGLVERGVVDADALVRAKENMKRDMGGDVIVRRKTEKDIPVFQYVEGVTPKVRRRSSTAGLMSLGTRVSLGRGRWSHDPRAGLGGHGGVEGGHGGVEGGRDGVEGGRGGGEGGRGGVEGGRGGVEGGRGGVEGGRGGLMGTAHAGGRMVGDGPVSIFSVADGKKLASMEAPALNHYDSLRMAKIQRAALESPTVLGGYRVLPEMTPGRALLWGTVLAVWGTGAVVMSSARYLGIEKIDDVSVKMGETLHPVGAWIRNVCTECMGVESAQGGGVGAGGEKDRLLSKTKKFAGELRAKFA